MKKYVSHKVVEAAKILAANAMPVGGFQLQLEDHQVVDVPENFYARGGPYPEDLGYLVVYEDGYKSWTPAKPFEDGYTLLDEGTAKPLFSADNISEASGVDFSLALKLLKSGKPMRRAGWNGKGQFVVMMPSLYLPPYNTQDTAKKVNDRTAKWIGEDQPLDCQPYFAIYNSSKQWQPGWVPSTGDCLANDWQIVGDK